MLLRLLENVKNIPKKICCKNETCCKIANKSEMLLKCICCNGSQVFVNIFILYLLRLCNKYFFLLFDFNENDNNI
jgi:hypothetical protein